MTKKDPDTTIQFLDSQFPDIRGLGARPIKSALELLDSKGHPEACAKLERFVRHVGRQGKVPDCLLRNPSFWFKLPVILRDIHLFKDKDVIDVGSMCGLSSMLFLTSGEARTSTMIEQNPRYANACKGFMKNRTNSVVFTGQLKDYLRENKLSKNNIIYLSDILYHFRPDLLKALSERISNTPGLTVLAYSNECRAPKNKNSYEFEHHKGVNEFLLSCMDEVNYIDESHKLIDKLIVPSRPARRPGHTRLYLGSDPFKNWIGLVGVNKS